MPLDERDADRILDFVWSLPLANRIRREAAVVLVGSLPAGLSDELSDVDLDLIVPAGLFRRLYAPYWTAVDKGKIEILNPRARLFDEYPITNLPHLETTHGHIHVKNLATIRSRIPRDDETRWIYANSLALADPAGVHRRLKRTASDYPQKMLQRRRAAELFAAKGDYYGIKLPLDRRDAGAVGLIAGSAINHILRYACLCDGKPYPYLKWLIRVGTQTRLGGLIADEVWQILEEARQDPPRQTKPQSYVKPDHRNAAYESYPIYQAFVRLFGKIDEFRRNTLGETVK
jgi:hypothetical protein